MITSGNTEIKNIYYNGKTIKKVFSCGGYVWSGDTPTPPIPPVGDKKVVGITTANTQYYGNDCEVEFAELLGHDFPIPASAISASEVGTCITIIGSGAFTNSVNMTTLVLPNTISYIRNVMLDGCSSMQSLTVYATTPPTFYATGGGSISNCGLFSAERQPSEPPEPIPTGFVIYVPCDSVNAYKTADVWSRYTDYIQEISGTCSSTTKFFATYTGGITYSAECDSNTTLSTATTKSYNVPSYTAMTSAEIGDCVTTIGLSALEYCSNLTSVTVSDNIEIIGSSAFRNCSILSRFNSNTNGEFIMPSGTTTIGDGVFQSCSAMTSLYMYDNVTSIGRDSFNICKNLSSVRLSNALITIGQSSFESCYGLSSIIIPNSVTSIGNNAFNGCFSLTSIDIPDSVTNIGNQVFQNCRSLTNATIGSGVTSIGNMAFNACTALTSVTVNATTPPTLGTNAFDYNASGRIIYVPDAVVNDYKTANNWSTYADKIKQISEKP